MRMIQFIIGVKFLMESRRMGIVSLTKELQYKNCSQIHAITSDLELLQPQYIEEIFDSSVADLKMLHTIFLTRIKG